MDSSQLNILPDSTLVEILGYLENEPAQIANIGRVCRRLYRVSRDKSLWRRVNLTQNQRFNLQKMRQFLRTRLAADMTSLKVEGYLRNGCHFGNTRSSVTDNFFDMLSVACPQLKEFHIVYASCQKFSLAKMPTNLEFVSFSRSVVDYKLLEKLNDAKVLPRLHGLDLSFSHGLSSKSGSVRAILQKKALQMLNLRHCFKVSKVDLCEIPYSLPNLVKLDLADCQGVDDDFLFHLANRNSDSLQDLDVSCNKGVTDRGIAYFSRADGLLKSLEKLNLSETSVTEDSLPFLAQFSNLSFLSLRKVVFSAEKVRGLQANLYKRCRILFGYGEGLEENYGGKWWLPVKNVGENTADVGELMEH